MGPLTSLAPNRSASMDITWHACRCSGVTKVVPAGVVAEKLTVKEGMVTGKFGVFYSGTLQIAYFDKSGKQIALDSIMGVSPLDEVVIKQDLKKLVYHAHTARYQVQSYDKKFIGVLDELQFQ